MKFDMNLEERDIIPLMFETQKQVVANSHAFLRKPAPNMNSLEESYTELATVTLNNRIQDLQEQNPGYSDMEATALVCNYTKLYYETAAETGQYTADLVQNKKDKFIDSCIDAGFKSKDNLEKSWNLLYTASIN